MKLYTPQPTEEEMKQLLEAWLSEAVNAMSPEVAINWHGTLCTVGMKDGKPVLIKCRRQR